jgi:Tol biopolymer transport system component
VALTKNGDAGRTVARCPSDCSRLAWTHTGRRIAWSSGASLFESALWGQPEDVLTSDYEAGYDPSWAPRSEWLVYSTDRTALASIIATDTRSNAETTPAQGYAPSWCPDGTIVFIGRGGHLYAVRRDGRRLRRISGGDPVRGRPDCAPRGGLVIYDTLDRAVVVGLDGRRRRSFSPANGAISSPVWSPSGRRLAWSDGHDIWVSRPDFSRRRRFTRRHHDDGYTLPTWQPLPRRAP